MTFSNEIIKILDDLSKRLGVAIDWSNKNIMTYLNDLIDRFIKWEIATSTVNIVLGIVIGIVGGCMTKNIWKNRNNHTYFGDMDEGITWAFIGGIACIVAGVLVVALNCDAIVEAIFLPEMTIYNYVTNLINTK